MTSVLQLPPGNLPIPATTFVGRELALAQVDDLLGRTRLLTLAGPGGVRKSRLAIEVGSRFQAQASEGPGDALVPKGPLDDASPGPQLVVRRPSFLDGVWLVELAGLSDPALLLQTVAAALRLPEEPGIDPGVLLIDSLYARQLLFILDNCEHLLEARPELRILATSREPLGVPGETIYRVLVLTLPEKEGDGSVEAVMRSEAGRLFVQRARDMRDDFHLTQRNAAAVATISRNLDGISLALELAAARVKLLSAEQITVRLNDRFQLLTTGSRFRPAHQRTLRLTVDWSYDLLRQAERLLFNRLAVFVGGFTLEAVEQVAAGSLAAPETQPQTTLSETGQPVILDLVASLID
ncbi:MAG: ATP-binding protein [Dehalococcoidia bacterium]